MQNVMKTPRSVDIDITNRCNLRCLYCSHFTSSGDVVTDLQTDEWLTFFHELSQCAVMNVTLQGGEPFIREDIHEIIDGIVRNNMRYSILSNGTLINEDHAAYLAATRRCNHVQVSLDGSCAEVHDSCRGKGTFDKAVNAIQCLQRYSVPVTVRVTIHHRNVHDLENVAKFILEDLHLPSFSTNSASYLGLCRQNSDQVSLTVGDRNNAMSKLLFLNTKYGGRITAQAGPLADARMWSSMIERHRKGGITAINEEGSLSSCGGCYSRLAVRADGIYVPCILLPMIELGHVNQDSLKEIWQHNQEISRLRTRRTIPLSTFKSCRGCTYQQYCQGGCPALSASSTGDAYKPSLDSCLKLFLEMNGGVISF